jgi:uncharacterized membrane protein
MSSSGGDTRDSLSRGESRWPAAIATVVAIVLQLRLPENLSLGPTYVVPALAMILLIPLIILHPRRFSAASRPFKGVSVALIASMNVGNVTSLALLLHRLLNGSKVDGRSLILSAVEIWLTSVIIFALWFWEIDRGGPICRARGERDDPDFLFAQMTDPSLVTKSWTPTFIDYLYVSLTNSTAFSPTDTLPLRSRVKMLMGAQSVASLAIIAVLGARAVNILN